MKALLEVTAFWQGSAPTALTSLRTDGDDLTSPAWTMEGSSFLTTPCSAEEVYFGQGVGVSKTSQSLGCEPLAEWSSSNSLSEHGSSAPACPHAQTHSALKLWWSHSTERWHAEIYLQTPTSPPWFCKLPKHSARSHLDISRVHWSVVC